MNGLSHPILTPGRFWGYTTPPGLIFQGLRRVFVAEFGPESCCRCHWIHHAGMTVLFLHIGMTVLFLHIGMTVLFLHIGMRMLFLHIGMRMLFLHIGMRMLFLHIRMRMLFLHIGMRMLFLHIGMRMLFLHIRMTVLFLHIRMTVLFLHIRMTVLFRGGWWLFLQLRQTLRRGCRAVVVAPLTLGRNPSGRWCWAVVRGRGCAGSFLRGRAGKNTAQLRLTVVNFGNFKFFLNFFITSIKSTRRRHCAIF